jgi:hypothetical protein
MFISLLVPSLTNYGIQQSQINYVQKKVFQLHCNIVDTLWGLSLMP